jgi:hypothetical protein
VSQNPAVAHVPRGRVGPQLQLDRFERGNDGIPVVPPNFLRRPPLKCLAHLRIERRRSIPAAALHRSGECVLDVEEPAFRWLDAPLAGDCLADEATQVAGLDRERSA